MISLLMLGFVTTIQGQLCPAPDITISSDVTWQNQTIFMEPDRKIIITNGATLTIRQCTLRRAFDCPGYWDGIYLITTAQGNKAALRVENSVIEFSQSGIQAPDGWRRIELISSKMLDNGQMINVRDSWPLAPIGGGGLTDGEPDDHRTQINFPGKEILVFDGGEGGGAEPCSNDVPPPKVIISGQCQMRVKDSGNPAVDPPKKVRQVSVLGGELRVSNSIFVNGQSTYLTMAISASRGMCRIAGSWFQDFHTAIYKGTDAQALCNSEGLILTGSVILDPQHWAIFNAPEFAIYNVSANALVKGNIIEGNIWSEGISYGGLFNNNITRSDNLNSSALIESPAEAWRIRDNKFFNTFTEYYGDNRKTDATCNKWVFEDYAGSPAAVVAGGLNQFPLSWGTIQKATGNLWDITLAEMYDVSANSGTLNYYYRDVSDETFYLSGIFPRITENRDTGCTYDYPVLLADLDTSAYFLSDEALQAEYHTTDSLLTVIKSTSDTTQVTVREIIAELERRLSGLTGSGLLFMDTTSRGFWAEKVNPRMKELANLNALWYAHDMDSILSLLSSHSDPDAQTLYDAAALTSDLLDGSDLYSFSPEEVATLDSIARTTYGDYTNILRNFLFMVYDSLIIWERERVLDSLRGTENFPGDSSGNPNEIIPELPVSDVYPNPLTGQVAIIMADGAPEDAVHSIEIMTLEGRVVMSGTFTGSLGQFNLGHLEAGMYLMSIRNSGTGVIEVHRIYKSSH